MNLVLQVFTNQMDFEWNAMMYDIGAEHPAYVFDVSRQFMRMSRITFLGVPEIPEDVQNSINDSLAYLARLRCTTEFMSKYLSGSIPTVHTYVERSILNRCAPGSLMDQLGGRNQ